MSYQVIARKYRPQRFEGVVGQEHVTQTLGNAIRRNRIAHAYLFVGPRGTGKTTIARIFAKCLNCTDGPRVDFAEDDPRCREITEGRSLDVLEIDGASNRGIEEIRALRETVKYAPASSRFKIYIIDEVHMLTKEAFNALLKTLEEPPPHVKFMFATTEPEKVLPTILSRCQRFDLRRIPDALIVSHLGLIAGQEKVKIQPEALQAIARGADGGMRDAESTLDQLISFCGTEIVESDVLSMFGLAAQGQLFALSEAILKNEAETALRELNSLAAGGKDLGRLLADLLNHFRNLLIFLLGKGDQTLLEVSENEAASLASQAGLTTVESVTRIMDVLSDGEARFRDTSSRKIVMEITLLRAIEAKNSVSIDTVLRQLQALRPEQGATPNPPDSPPPTPATPSLSKAFKESISASAVKTPSENTVPRSAPVKSASDALSEPPPAIAAPVADLNGLWAQVVEGVGRASPFTKTYLIEAHPVSFNKNVFIIGFDPEFADHIGLVDNSRVHTHLRTKMNELGHADVQFKFIKAEAPPGWKNRPGASTAAAEPAPASPKGKTPQANDSSSAPKSAGTKSRPESVPFNKEDFKNDPLIQKALEVFKGQIVEVRS